MSDKDQQPQEQQQQPLEEQQAEDQYLDAAYQVRYKAYHVEGFDPRRDVYALCELYEVFAREVTLHSTEMEKWFKKHPNAKHKLAYGKDQIIAIPQEVKYYNDFPDPEGGLIGAVAGASYCVLVEQINKRVYFDMPEIELKIWLSEAEKEINLKLIRDPIPGIVPAREILSACHQENLLHPIYEKHSQQTQREITKQIEVEEIKTFVPARSCGMFDCRICYSTPNIFEQRQIVVLGKSRFDAQAVALTKKYRADPEAYDRAKRLELLKIAMQIMAVSNSTLDTIDKLDDANDAAHDDGDAATKESEERSIRTKRTNSD